MRYLLLVLSTALLATAQLRLQPVAEGLRSPTAIAAVPNGSGALFVLEQPGRLRAIVNGALLPAPVLTVTRLRSGGERGLLGIAFPPGFAEKRYFYLNYTDTAGATVVSRWRLSASDPFRADADSEEVILRIARTQSNHNGGNIVFGPDGYLYIGTGDSGGAGDPENAAQNPMDLRGKMLRIDTESGTAPYAVPATNPFSGRTGYRAEIWALGFRNPWRYSFDSATGDLWIADVGQNRAEEVNVQPASGRGGENYGWPSMEGLECFRPSSGCNREGLTMPAHEYGRALGISITGGYVYRGSQMPSLAGSYIYGDFGSGRIWALRRSGSASEVQELLDSTLQISAFGEDDSHELYVADYGSGRVFRLASGGPSFTAAGVVNAASFGPGLVPGSLATVFGSGISALDGIVAPQGFPLPAELAGTRITMNGVAVPLLAVARVRGQEQINFQVPFELAGTTRATLVVHANGASGQPVEVALESFAPGVFATTRNGSNMTVWATGLGPVSNAPQTGQPAPAEPLAQVLAPLEVTIGGTPAPMAFSGLAPGFAGLYQLNVSVPAGAAGDVVIRTGGVRPQRQSGGE